MAKTYITLTTRVDQTKNRINDITNLIGDLTLLTTGDTPGGDSDVVTAINELDSDIGLRPATNLTTTAKTLTEAINELDSDLGAISGLTTTDKSSLVNALNEIDALVSTNITDIATLDGRLDSDETFIGNQGVTTTASTITGAINELDSDVGSLASLSTVDKSNMVNAVNEAITRLDSDSGLFGSSNFTTTATTVTGAINELDSDVGSISGLTTTDKSSIVTAINELDSDVGVISGLTTTDKSSLVNAMNEHESRLDSSDTNFATDVRNLLVGGTGITYTAGTGTIDVTDSSIGATALAVTGNGTLGQALASKADGTMYWGYIVPGVYDSDGTLLNGG